MPSLQDSMFYHITQASTPLRCVPTWAVRCRLFEPDANHYSLIIYRSYIAHLIPTYFGLPKCQTPASREGWKIYDWPRDQFPFHSLQTHNRPHKQISFFIVYRTWFKYGGAKNLISCLKIVGLLFQDDTLIDVEFYHPNTMSYFQ